MASDSSMMSSSSCRVKSLVSIKSFLYISIPPKAQVRDLLPGYCRRNRARICAAVRKFLRRKARSRWTSAGRSSSAPFGSCFGGRPLLPCRLTVAQLFLLHGFHDHLFEFRRVSFIWYALWHGKAPHFLVLSIFPYLSNKWGAVQPCLEGVGVSYDRPEGQWPSGRCLSVPFQLTTFQSPFSFA